MKIVRLLLVLPILLGLNFLSCSQSNSTAQINDYMQNVSIDNSPKNLSDAEEVLRQLENRYYAFTFYKAKAQNIYSRKGFGEETSVKRELEIEYTSPSKIKVQMSDGKNTKTLTSRDNIAFLSIDGEKKKDYDDVYWGLTSSEFGDGVFFEVGKILILKERGQGELSSIRNLENPLILGEETIDEKACYKIQGSVKEDNLAKITYWIDKETFVIRQYERLLLAKKVPNGYFKTIETYTDIEAR